MKESRPSIQRFEELIAWQKARALARSIYQATKTEALSKDYGLSGQMQRAATSVMSNIAEGFERGTQAEFRRFVIIAKGSCAELRSQLYLAEDIGYLKDDRAKALSAQAQELARILGGLLASLNHTRP
jgi:four helix bundle protein